ncbi:hypothetical protein DH2020_004316 [Rehmannia glutinosa]|uniref:Cytochrome b5 heme-binding domain-containing protein n=1 Tax=Rehmannia glutinosa TaxID=99300 RepID=A0ABR0XP33_REHGL
MCSHTDRITAIATAIDNSDMIVTSSHDKSPSLCGLSPRRTGTTTSPAAALLATATLLRTLKRCALEHNDKVIGESLDLVKYVDANFKGPLCYRFFEAKSALRDREKKLDEVYNVTTFLDEHPGGDEIMLGKDVTDEFDDVGHNHDAWAMLEKYYLLLELTYLA